MDEILVANFMVFHDAVEGGEYDLVIGDEAWDVDHFLHENPELKRTAFAWMTDFVGWLPMPSGGEREAFLTADYNAEMIEHVERFPRLRDRAIFVGDPDDIVPDDFGPGLPSIRDWTERHFAFSGYVTGFDPAPLIERSRGAPPRARLPRRRAGRHRHGRRLRRRRGAAAPGHRQLSRRRASGQRPADDRRRRPADRSGVLDAPAGVEVRAFVPDLYRHLGGLRPGGRPGRADHDDGAGRRPPPVPVLPAAQPLRAEPPRPPPPRALRRGPADGLRRIAARRSSPRRSPPRSTGRSTTGRSRPTARPARRRSSRRSSDRSPARRPLRPRAASRPARAGRCRP